MERDKYFKQTELLNPSTEGGIPIHIYGCGSIGSHLAVGLAKTGFYNITIYDMDIVEQDNIPAQFFSLESVGDRKTTALYHLIKEMVGTNIKTQEIEIKEDFMPDVEANSLHITAFDNIEARQIIANALEGYPVHYMDGRIGRYQWEKYYVRCNTKADWQEFMKTLDGDFSELTCGEKCLWAVNSQLSSKLIADTIRLVKDRIPYAFEKANIMGVVEIKREKWN